ncbi:MAG TPA: hypothetical protein VEQ41_10085 [Solirubrobacterales bacterium]|nr:hypothetical protein [Solirubrobacterales bacterium]
MTRERAAMLALWAAAALACLLGFLAPPSAGSHEGVGQQALDLLRVLTATALVVTLLLGPGVVLRALSGRHVGLGFLPLPGLALLVAAGAVGWLLADQVDVRLACFAVVGPVLGLLLGGLLGAGPRDMLSREERRALVLASFALGLAVARSLWSLGPEGELYEGTISRTFVPEGRPDSRTSFLVAQLVAHGADPFGPNGILFAPYNFSSRGPLPGMASAPIILLSGGDPALGAPETPWQPFDHQGFMAFRIAMIAFSCTVLLALWDLVRRLAGSRAARFALLLGATTPFLFADLWFTWPKLLAATFVLLAGICVIERRGFRAGLLVSAGYLMHPSALIGLSGLGLVALWPIAKARLLRPQLLVAALLAAGVAIGWEGWQWISGPYYIQDGFIDYVTQAYPHYEPTARQWIEFRLNSLGNTLVPLFLPVFHSDSVSINELFGHSPPVVHFFFQPWTGVPFGLGILFFPLLLASLWRAARRWPWAVFATVIVPLAAFAVYWGASITGYLREGIQAWVFVLIAVVAVQQAVAGFPWLRSRPIRAILSLRALEVLAVAVGATLGTRAFDPLGAFALTDAVALVAIVALSALLAATVWRETGEGLRP